MEDLQEHFTEGLANLVLCGLALTPILALAKALGPVPLTWTVVLLPWVGSFHLLLCWRAARIIAQVFWDLARFLA